MSEADLPRDARIYVAGHRGMVGSAIVRALQAAGHTQLITRGRDQLDLREQSAVREFFAKEKPEFVFLAAARVGGILANDTYRADFIYENLAIQTHVIHHAWKSGVRRLLFLGSSCIYPKLAPQPLKEEYLLSGPLESTNQPYAIAKIAGIEMCDAYNRQHGTDFRSVMPTNLYGPGDNYDLSASHVIPALIRKAHEAKLAGSPHMEIWGSGRPRREFLHVDDLAAACVFIMRQENARGLFNVGTGEDLTTLELATLINRVVGFKGEIRLDTRKPDGTPRKLLDVTRIHQQGWRARIGLEDGLRQTYRNYLDTLRA